MCGELWVSCLELRIRDSEMCGKVEREEKVF